MSINCPLGHLSSSVFFERLSKLVSERISRSRCEEEKICSCLLLVIVPPLLTFCSLLIFFISIACLLLIYFCLLYLHGLFTIICFA